MPSKLVPCPQVGHKQFQNALKFIELGDVEKPEQISKFIRPHMCVNDGSLGMQYSPGELQKADLASIPLLFEHPHFILRVFRENESLFRNSQCRIYQFQTAPRNGPVFIFGTFVTDGTHNLIDFCIDTRQCDKRRAILFKLIRAICTPQSIAQKTNH